MDAEIKKARAGLRRTLTASPKAEVIAYPAVKRVGHGDKVIEVDVFSDASH